MIDFIDKTNDRPGTPLNRANLMALQGFQALTTTFTSDGKIIETDGHGSVLQTYFNPDGSIVESYSADESKTISKITKFEADGSITEVVE